MDMKKLSLEQLQAVLEQCEQDRQAAKERGRAVQAEIAERMTARTVTTKLRNNARLKPNEQEWVAALDDAAREQLVREASTTMNKSIQRAVADAAKIGIRAKK